MGPPSPLVAEPGAPPATVRCDVWLLAEADVDAVVRVLDATAHLSADELDRHRRLVRPASRRRHLGARVLARWGLARYVDVTPANLEFVRDDVGRPRLHPRHPAVDFNLTHTDGMIGCAVLVPAPTGGRVGLDAETFPARPEAARLVDAVLTPRERERLVGASVQGRLELLAEHWVLKEAYTKLLGLGLRHPFDSFEVRDLHRAPRVHDPRDTPAATAGLEVALLHAASGHVLAVAAAGAGDDDVALHLHVVDAAATLAGVSGATAMSLPLTRGGSVLEVSAPGQSGLRHPHTVEATSGPR